MDRYLKETRLPDFKPPVLDGAGKLSRDWAVFPEYERIARTHDSVQNENIFGYRVALRGTWASCPPWHVLRSGLGAFR